MPDADVDSWTRDVASRLACQGYLAIFGAVCRDPEAGQAAAEALIGRLVAIGRRPSELLAESDGVQRRQLRGTRQRDRWPPSDPPYDL